MDVVAIHVDVQQTQLVTQGVWLGIFVTGNVERPLV
jgi:hypothetical protein